jgi:hypothetical protein
VRKSGEWGPMFNLGNFLIFLFLAMRPCLLESMSEIRSYEVLERVSGREMRDWAKEWGMGPNVLQL